MGRNRCRVCDHALYKEPLLRYTNMPGAAQYLPDAETIESDRGVDLEVCQCSGCGLVQLSNPPVAYYKEVIRAAAFSEEMKDFRIKQFGSFIKKYSLKGKKVIEIGCGRGEYLSLMQQCGADAYGLEYAEASVDHCVASDLNVQKGFVEFPEQKLLDAPFNGFFMLNYLEHLPDVNATLTGICGNLTDDAVGLVEVPNFDMIVRKRLFSEFIGDHLFYFTKRTLRSVLELNGFDVIECNEIWQDYIISVVVRKRMKTDLSHFAQQRTHLKKEIDAYIGRFPERQVAIWGAGHQALAVISLTDLAGKIKYVVDSAVLKQGKYTPATHIAIVSPDALRSDPVEAVIVMAASYSDEVVRVLRQKFDENINIAILRDFGLEGK